MKMAKGKTANKAKGHFNSTGADTGGGARVEVDGSATTVGGEGATDKQRGEKLKENNKGGGGKETALG